MIYPNRLKDWNFDCVKAPGLSDRKRPNIRNMGSFTIAQAWELSRQSKSNFSSGLGINIALTLAYDGTSYYGWQKCSSGPSIEQTLQQSLETILQHPVKLQAASRTDRGVHAKGQVVNFFSEKTIDLGQLAYSLNALLPSSLVVLAIEEKSSNFHPTLDVIAKEYVYYLCNRSVQLPQHRLFSWHIPKPLDLNLMKVHARQFIGKHDFEPFCNKHEGNTYESTVRTVYSIEIEHLEENRVKISLTADHFLYKMARNLIGTLVELGLGKKIERGICAPAHGLTLNRVHYCAKLFNSPYAFFPFTE